jgi:hypothetical protein
MGGGDYMELRYNQHTAMKYEAGLQKEYYPRSGHIAVILGFITMEQLKGAMSQQIDDDLHNRPHRFLGEILLDEGWITHDELNIILDELYKEEMRAKGKL